MLDDEMRLRWKHLLFSLFFCSTQVKAPIESLASIFVIIILCDK